MGKNSNDAGTYWRTSVAVKLADKPVLEQKLKAAGLATVGDLVSLLLHAEGAVEALQPIARAYQAKNASKVTVKEAAKKLQGLDPAALDRLIELASKEVAAA